MAFRIAAVTLAAALISTPVLSEKVIEKVDPVIVGQSESSPSGGMTADMLYEFLLAEIASQRNQGEVAAEAYAELARETRDPRIAQRAVEVALANRDGGMGLAVKATNLWLELEPNSIPAQQTLIALLLTTGKISEAVNPVQRLLAAQPDNAGRVFLQLAGLMTRYPDKPAVLILMKDLASSYQTLPEARFATAQAAKLAEQPELALSESKAALQLRPDWELAAQLHGEVLSKSAPQRAIKFYREFLAKHPQSREIRTNLARDLANEKDFAGARKEFQFLITAAPNTAEYHLALGILSMEMKDYSAAEKHLTRTLQLNFRDPDVVRTYLGQLNEDQKRYTEAIGWYRQVEEGDGYFASHVRVAFLMAKQGDLKGGRAYLSSVRTASPEQKSLLVIADAQLLRDAKQYEAALDVLSQGLKSQPDSLELLYDRAMTAEKLDRMDMLEADLRKVMVLKPDYAQAYNALGYTFAERNIRLTEGLELIEKANLLEPEDAAILDSMGWIQYRIGNLDKSLDFLRRALAMRPDPEIAAHLAEVLLARGQRGEAKTVSEKALHDNPDNEALLAVVKKLELH
ncbi:MAG: tetratricopeptide repeat protein [Pseudomonadota bacterium]